MQINATRRILRQKFCSYHKLSCQRNNGAKYRFIKIKRQEIKRNRMKEHNPMKRNRKIRKSETSNKMSRRKNKKAKQTVNGEFIKVILQCLFTLECETLQRTRYVRNGGR